MPTLRRRLSTFAIGLSLATVSSAMAQEVRPNIVYLLVDNWGWGDIGL